MTMSSDLVLVDIDSGVATVTLNRPEANNGWTGTLETAYFQTLERCENDDSVKAIVVTGAGRSFCPGADMNGLAGAANGTASVSGGAPNEGVPRGEYPLMYPRHIRKPLIGAINGACAGVGLIQALLFDVRFAAAGAKFTVAFARRGLIAEYGAAWLLPRIVGHSNAMDLLVSSRVVLAEEAKEMGLVNRVVAKEQLLDEAKAYALDVATNCSPTSIAIMKQQVERSWNSDFSASLEDAYRLMNETLRRPDFKEGVKSFIEKRSPTFGEIQADLLQ
jgi:enoyl-CoA hydratase/carnithine racemase